MQHQFTPAFISTVWPIWSLGIYRSLCNVAAFFGSYNAGKMLQKFSSFRVLIAGELIGMVITLIAVLFPGVWSPILIASTSVTFGITLVSLNALMQKEFSDTQRATMGSINSLFGNIFFALFAYLFGVMADHLGTRGPIMISEFLGLSVAYIYWKLFRNQHNHSETRTIKKG